MSTKEITSINCSDCGKTDDLNWMKSIKETLIARNLCHTCNFWFEYILKVDHPRSVRIAEEHYWIEEEDVPSNLIRGSYGRKFRIVFQNGRVVMTTNLWDQGKIPPRFRGRLPNNAEFDRIY